MNKKILLLIEDNPLLNGLYREAFEKAGLEVIFAFDALSGIELAKKNHPNLILLDLLMPGGDGFGVMKEVGKDPSLKNTKIVVLTVVTKDEDKNKAKELGAIDYLIKSDMKLDQIVKRVLAHLNDQ